MFNNSSKILFLIMMMMGTMISVTSNSWLSAWMGLEINLLSFIPLMSDNNLMSTEASLKYFLTQAFASTILLFSIIMLLLKNNVNMDMNNSLIFYILLSSLLPKSGAAPFHFWFPNMMEGLTWINSLLLMTWQKIAPLMLISYMNNNNNLLLISSIMSVMIGALSGLNQTSLRKLMAFSSINHLGWMLMSLMINESLWIMYFMFYSFLSIILIMMFNMFKTYHLNQLFSIFFYQKTLKFVMFMNFLSLGGLPPFLGFFPKWLVIQQLTFNNQLFSLFILLMTTLITLFFYLRVCYSAFMLNYFEMNTFYKMKINNFYMKIYLMLSFISIFGLSLISLFYFML
uniref:NADH-ubiquinone oxidoreductase chain 2 n=1 Tax=Apenthecia hispida TaxID=1136914 RepID=A0A678N480_9MUSC|nr:NADH dehydrogenase subunit 2 [Apenthecia hispida]